MNSGYYKTKESVEEYILLAKDVNSGQLIAKLREFLPEDSSILEIGSGPGTDWNMLDQSYAVTGSDNSLEFLAHLKKNNPKGKFLELDAITLETKEIYDGIYSNKVLHHLKDQELKESVIRQSEILNPGGIICHSFWKGTGDEIFKGLFVNYHDKQRLKALFEPGFEIILIEEYPEFEEGDSLVLIGRKKQPS